MGCRSHSRRPSEPTGVSLTRGRFRSRHPCRWRGALLSGGIWPGGGVRTARSQGRRVNRVGLTLRPDRRARLRPHCSCGTTPLRGSEPRPPHQAATYAPPPARRARPLAFRQRAKRPQTPCKSTDIKISLYLFGGRIGGCRDIGGRAARGGRSHPAAAAGAAGRRRALGQGFDRNPRPKPAPHLAPPEAARRRRLVERNAEGAWAYYRLADSEAPPSSATGWSSGSMATTASEPATGCGSSGSARSQQAQAAAYFAKVAAELGQTAPAARARVGGRGGDPRRRWRTEGRPADRSRHRHRPDARIARGPLPARHRHRFQPRDAGGGAGQARRRQYRQCAGAARRHRQPRSSAGHGRPDRHAPGAALFRRSRPRCWPKPRRC